MSVAAIHSLSLLKQTLSSIEYQRSSQVEIKNNVPSRYESRPPVNGLYSERSSSCYNAIKKKRMLRQGRSKSHLKTSSRQRATIAVGQANQLKSDISLGHCIDHLDSIIQLLKKQKKVNEQEAPVDMKTQKIQEQIDNRKTEIKVNNQNTKKIAQTSTQKNTVEKRYRTLSHNTNMKKQEQDLPKTIQPRESIILRFNKNKSFQQQKNDIKPLITKIINDTKRQSKTLRLKQIRDRYKHLSKSKSTQNYQLSTKINPTIIVNQPNKRYGKRMMRVCSTSNYQVNSYDNRKSGAVEGKGNRYLRYQFKQIQKQEKLIEQNNIQQIAMDNPKVIESQKETQKQIHQNQKKAIKKLYNPFIQNKQNVIQQQSQKSQGFDLKDINCSKIDKIFNKSYNSFFSEIPSYLQSTKKSLKQKSIFNKNNEVKPFGNQEDDVLKFVELESMQIKKIFKAKEKRRQLEKWKRNFPQGFFEQARV